MRIFELNNLPAEEFMAAGGKARGLSRLCAAGLKIAQGFVIIGLNPESQDEINQIAQYYNDSNLGNVAVRSSATSEDGVDFSGAGQYKSFLNIKGEKAFLTAVLDCMKSLHSETANSYSKFFAGAKSVAMSVVVQKMADASAAGVCFTADPMTNSGNIVIEAVEGLGESLVSGEISAERYIINKDNLTLCEKNAENTLLDIELLYEISQGALKAKEYFECELDLEWAIDKTEGLVWLQSRPITTLDEAEIDEFDCKDDTPNTVFTNCNIGEMLPGAVTPLTLSTSVRSIDEGLMRMMIKSGAYKKKELLPNTCVVSFSNHLFFNLTKINKMATTIAGAAKEQVEASICGRTLEDTPPLPWKNKNGLIRLKNGISYFRYLLSGKKAMKKIDKIASTLTIDSFADYKDLYNQIDKKLPFLNDAASYHYVTSANSGAMSSTFITILKTKNFSEDDAKIMLAGLLEDIDGIESVDILRSMRSVGRKVLKLDKDAQNLSPAELMDFIKSDSDELNEQYQKFILRHGHRGIREAEMRQKSWKRDEEALASNLLTVIASGAVEAEKAINKVSARDEVLKNFKGMTKKILGYIINQARSGVYRREFTKARFVKVIDVFKEAYEKLGNLLFAEGALPDADLIYFLTHKEIGELIFDKKAKLIKRASQRRRLLDEQKKVVYNDVYIGLPKPVKTEDILLLSSEVLKGNPISRGEYTGRARIVTSVDDAKKLQEGEIMVAKFTDIGWSPYYSLIGALVTEVGSALSHGAVVAREYGLPLVVNIKHACKIINTGDVICVNGTLGTVTLIESAKID